MNRLFLLAATATAVGIGTLTHEVFVDPPVNLQASTPGTQQSGNINVSGTVLGSTVFASAGGTTAKAVSGWATSPTGFVFGGDFRTASTDGRGVFGSATALSGSTYGGDFRSASPSGRGIFGFATATTGQGIGGDFRSDSPNGKGIMGRANAATGQPIGVYGQTTNANGYGVYSEGNMAATGIISGNGSGLTNVDANKLGGFSASSYLKSVPVPLYVVGSVDGSTATILNSSQFSGAIGLTVEMTGISNAGRTFAGDFRNSNADGVGLVATGFSTGISCTGSNTTGPTYGIVALSSSPDNESVGVYGFASASAGATQGGRFVSSSNAGIGVFGHAQSLTGSTFGVVGQSQSSAGRAMYGIETAATGTTYGVYGQVFSPTGFGVYSNGNTGASGVKAFRIDHPNDPENKYLLHYSAESPMPQNFYVGNVVTDGRGYAWVELPDYFAEINTNFKYQLTVVDGPNSSEDDFVQVKVREKIKGNRFLIRTSAPHIEVSWRVDADRNDRFVRRNPPKDVVDKEGPERGTYQQPELYGLGPDRGMNRDMAKGQPRTPFPPETQSLVRQDQTSQTDDHRGRRR